MILLDHIPEKFILSIDIETVRIVDKYEDLSEEFKSAWEYKNKQNGEIPDFDELSDLWTRTSSLYSEFSEICAVSITLLDKTETGLLCKEYYGPDELTILVEVGTFLNAAKTKDANYRLMGHAAKYFDYPFLCKRFVINRLPIPYILDTAHLKPWETTNICTNMDIWKMGGTGPGGSLQAICTSLGIPISKTDLVGDEVGKAYYNKEYERIGRYCSQDTIATFNIIRAIKNESLFKFDEVKYLSEEVSTSEDSVTALEKLYSLDNLTKEVQEEVRELCSKVKLTKKDKENLKRILKGIYLRDDFINRDQDTKAVKERKIAEVEKFMKII